MTRTEGLPPRGIEPTPNSMLSLLRDLHATIRTQVLETCEQHSSAQLAAVADDGPGDTIFVIDKITESLLVEQLEKRAASVGGLVLIAEGIGGGHLSLPRGLPPDRAAWRVLCDPIDGTRCLMYQKRSAWILTGAAPNNGEQTRLSDITVAVQTELPILKQHLCDELWAIKGQGAHARRYNRLTGEAAELHLQPSRAPGIEQGYAMIGRFFPGARDELAAIDEELMQKVLGCQPSGKALCFEEQYPSTGGQLYELMCGHDRFNADLRPLMHPLLMSRGMARGLCCHPYDICTALIATELGVLLQNPDGTPLDTPLDIDTDVAWVGYCNAHVQRQVEGPLLDTLRRRALI